MLAVVTGGSGRLGNVLVRELVRRGVSVRILEHAARPRSSLEGLGVEIVQGSVLDLSAVRSLVTGADIVYHLAAKIDLSRDVSGNIRAVNFGGAENVVEAVIEQKVRLVHCSSHHALQRRPFDELFDETRPLAMREPCDYHRAKAEAEQMVLAAVARRGLDAVIVSPATLTGPHDYEPSIFGRALLDLYHQRVPLMLQIVGDYVDARDVAAGLIAAAENGRRGERYLLSRDVLEAEELLALWGEVCGRSMPRRIIPLWVGWAALPASALAARITGRPPPFSAGMLRAGRGNRLVSYAKARRELDYRPRSLRDSLKDALAFYDERGWLRARPRLRAI